MDVIVKSLYEDWHNPSSLYYLSRLVKEKLEHARSVIAKSINCSPEEIIFTSSGSEANNLALGCFKELSCFKDYQYRKVYYDAMSHKSIINNVCDRQRDKQLVVNHDGLINVHQLKVELELTQSIQKIVSVCGANNEIGTIQPLEAIGAICRRYGALLHVDGTQLYPNQKIDVEALKIDLLSISGAKIGCPAGIGFLYVRKGIIVLPLIEGEQENGLRGGTENTPYILGLAKAVELLDYSKIDNLKAKRDYFIDKLLLIPNTYLVGSKDNRLANNVNICFKGIEASSLLAYLDLNDIYASGGSACNSYSLEPSHVLKAIRLPKEDIHSCVRFSLSEETTIGELDETVAIIKRFIKMQNTESGGKSI